MAMSSFRVVVLVVHLVLIMFRLDMAKAAAAAGGGGGADECAQQLVGMATCLPYVGGEATAPTPDCCSGLKQVLSKNKKCLCVIIQERNDPDLGLQINATLALGLPSVCNAPANVSKCPELLHLDPKSPEAQVFFQLQNNSTQIANNLAPSPSAGNDDPVRGIGVGSNSSSSGVAPQNHGGLLRWKDWSSSWGFTSVLIMVLPMFI